MDFIYSRKRIKFKTIKLNKKAMRIIIFLFVISFLIGIAITSVTPVFIVLCQDRAKSYGIKIMNEHIIKEIEGYSYSDFINQKKDDNENVVIIESNIININKVISNISGKIQDSINNIGNDYIKISIGSFTGVSLFSGLGVGIPIKISTIGSVKTDVKSELINKGINQTIHRIYLDINCQISVLTPFNTVTENVENKFIIAENVIIGDIPETYYNLDGMTADDTLNTIN